MSETEVREKLRQFILNDLIKDAKYALTDDEGIISGGLIGSFSLAEIGVFIEQEFNVFIPDPDLTKDKMNTLNLMVARIMRDLK